MALISTSLVNIPLVDLLLGLVCLWLVLRVKKRGHSHTPGPPTRPLIGNAHQIPKSGLYKEFREWAQQYGRACSLKIGPSNVVVLYDRRAIHNLLVEKGGNYFDRPPSYIGELLTQDDHVALNQMDSVWKERRKVISHTFSSKQLDEKHY